VVAAQQAVATAAVNVRSGQSTSSRIINHLNAGDTVSLVSATQEGRLLPRRKKSDGTKGWVYARYLRLATGPVTPPNHGHDTCRRKRSRHARIRRAQ